MDLQKLCIHTITNKPWSLTEALDAYCAKGIGGISIWQNIVETLGARETGRILHEYPIAVVSYVRGGFFAHTSEDGRQKAVDANKKLLDEAAEIGAPMMVLVCGSDPHQSLTTSRDQIKEAIEKLIQHATSLGITLTIEPLHPMYADTRSAVNTLEQANDLAEYFDCPAVGVAVDVYHLWWDPNLEDEIARCGRGKNLDAFHICDWKSPTTDMLNDRGLMGEGCIPIEKISNWISAAGFNGFDEVEIFSNNYWAMDQHEFLELIITAYINLHDD